MSTEGGESRGRRGEKGVRLIHLVYSGRQWRLRSCSRHCRQAGCSLIQYFALLSNPFVQATHYYSHHAGATCVAVVPPPGPPHIANHTVLLVVSIALLGEHLPCPAVVIYCARVYSMEANYGRTLSHQCTTAMSHLQMHLKDSLCKSQFNWRPRSPSAFFVLAVS